MTTCIGKSIVLPIGPCSVNRRRVPPHDHDECNQTDTAEPAQSRAGSLVPSGRGHWSSSAKHPTPSIGHPTCADLNTSASVRMLQRPIDAMEVAGISATRCGAPPAPPRRATPCVDEGSPDANGHTHKAGEYREEHMTCSKDSRASRAKVGQVGGTDAPDGAIDVAAVAAGHEGQHASRVHTSRWCMTSQLVTLKRITAQRSTSRQSVPNRSSPLPTNHASPAPARHKVCL